MKQRNNLSNSGTFMWREYAESEEGFGQSTELEMHQNKEVDLTYTDCKVVFLFTLQSSCCSIHTLYEHWSLTLESGAHVFVVFIYLHQEHDHPVFSASKKK